MRCACFCAHARLFGRWRLDLKRWCQLSKFGRAAVDHFYEGAGHL
jgi:hypothetical protein